MEINDWKCLERIHLSLYHLIEVTWVRAGTYRAGSRLSLALGLAAQPLVLVGINACCPDHYL